MTIPPSPGHGAQPGSQPPHAGMRPPAGTPPRPGAQQRQWSAPQQFRPIPDHELASQRSTRVTTRALVWSIVAIVVSVLPLLNWFTLAPGIVAIQYGVAARAQRLAGGDRAIWAIVLGALSLVGSAFWIVVHLIAIPALLGGALLSVQ